MTRREQFDRIFAESLPEWDAITKQAEPSNTSDMLAYMERRRKRYEGAPVEVEDLILAIDVLAKRYGRKQVYRYFKKLFEKIREVPEDDETEVTA